MSNMFTFITDVSLKDKNWFLAGGHARFYSEPRTLEEFEQAVSFARERQLPIFVLGSGANILISDEGFPGLVIHPKLTDISLEDSDQYVSIKAGAGVDFGELITYCLDNHALGLEEFSGIPGTVGGSVYINIHYFEFLLSQFLVSAEVIEKSSGKIMTVTNDWFNFGYDTSTLVAGDYYLLTATFKLKRAHALAVAYARGRHDEIIRYRARRYPTRGTCGSFFRNFTQEEVAHEKSGKNLIYVAYYLDRLGVKGELHVNDAYVSHQHANMIVNKGNATAADIAALAKKMQELVRGAFGIVPQPECQLIGFSSYPLLKQ